MDLFTRRKKTPVVPTGDILNPWAAPADDNGRPPPDQDALDLYPSPGGAPPGGPVFSPIKPITDAGLKARLIDVEERLSDLQAHFENKYHSLEQEVTRKLDQRWEKFELYDRRFKEYIRGEQETSNAQMITYVGSE